MSSESSDAIEKKKRSKAIDAGLEEDNKRLRKECKILLLGTAMVPPPDEAWLMRRQDRARAASRPSSSR
jgi:hypothetical protein